MPNVLVVDDDKLIRWSLNEIFSQEGYQVDAVPSVSEALERAKDKTYQLILADVEISNENGIEMLVRIKEFQPNSTIIILSACPKSKIEPLLNSLKVFCIIEKPFQAEQIRNKGKEAIRFLITKARDVEGHS